MIIPDIINDIKINKIVNKKTLINLLVIFSISNISLDKKNEEGTVNTICSPKVMTKLSFLTNL